MAFRNSYDPKTNYLFKNRLLGLMIETGENTARKLAKKLYEEGLVSVKTHRGNQRKRYKGI